MIEFCDSLKLATQFAHCWFDEQRKTSSNWLTTESVRTRKKPEQLVLKVVTQIDRIEDKKEKSNVTACTQLLAEIKFNENLLKAYFREDIMQESVVYNSILEKGLHKGIQQGEINLILKQLRRRFTNLDPSLEQKIS